MKGPFTVFETPAFIGVKDGDGLHILHILCRQINNDGECVREISDEEMFKRAELVAVALNRLGKKRLQGTK